MAMVKEGILRLTRNPVMLKELRGRMRGRRAFAVLTGYLLIMSAMIALVYLAFSLSSSNPYGPELQTTGKAVFATVVGVQVFLALFIGPAFTAGAISGEKERQTFELLRTTLLPATELARGKLLSALSYVVLLIVASIPLQSIAFMLGGISLSEVLLSQLIILVSALSFALIGLYASSIMRSTLAASVVTYGGAILLTFGLPVVALVITLITETSRYSASAFSWVTEAIIDYSLLSMAALNLPATLIVSDIFLVEQSTLWGFSELVRGHRIWLFSPWYVHIAIFGLLTLILYKATVRRLRRVATR